MFTSLPQLLRDKNLHSDIRTLLLIKKSMERGLVNTLGDLYNVLRGLVCNAPKDMGPFTVVFYQYFLDIDIKKGESLDVAISRSETFKNWKKQRYANEEPDLPSTELVNQFLDEVHLTTFDIQQILSGKEILENDDPNLKDTDGPDDAPSQRSNRMADYSDVSLEELLERMKQVMEQQKRRHSGGSHWVGTGGVSPYGHGGAAEGGIRVGGVGGGKMARAVIGDRNFYPVDTKVTLSDNNIDVALSYLKGIEEESVQRYLDIPSTIKEGVKQGGLFLAQEKDKIEQKVQVLLFIDNGGWSMYPYVKSVTKLFSKMKRRFAHDLKTYYFHNTIYGGAFTEPSRGASSFEDMEKICSLDKHYALFVIGDADMASYELSASSLADWQQLNERFTKSIWLNPMEQKFWPGSFTAQAIQRVFEMFPLSPWGIEKGVEWMNRKRGQRG